MNGNPKERKDLNLLFILADQFRADFLSRRLADSVQTPNIGYPGKVVVSEKSARN